jgi:hypothetical protein
MTKEKEPKPMGREPKPIDWDLVDKLLEAGCTGTEVAPYFNIHADTLYRRIQEEYGVTFTVYASEKQEKGNACLRHIQYLKAIGELTSGDNVQLVWLGKNRLKQKENPTELSISPETTKNFNTLMNQLDKAQQALKSEENSNSADSKS